MAQAKDKQHYIDSWHSQIDTLNGLEMPLLFADSSSNKYYDELQAIKERLKELVSVAADKDFD